MTPQQTPFRRLLALALGVLNPPAGRARIALSFAYGLVCHTIFALAVVAMIVAMFFGMSESFGRVPTPWAYIANAALVLQFPLIHSILLSAKGRRLLDRLAPAPHGRTLATTTYAIIASVQLLALFALWTPSGVIWWQAEGVVFGAGYTDANARLHAFGIMGIVTLVVGALFVILASFSEK